MRTIYLDHSASTPLHPDALSAMLPLFSDDYGNSTALHNAGRTAEHIIEEARRELAHLVHTDPVTVVFTSGGSESDNLALRGVALAAIADECPLTIITTPVEHPAVLKTAQQLVAAHGVSLRLVPVDHNGQVDPDALRTLLHHLPAGGVTLVSIIHANNEIGTINPIRDLALVAHEHGALFHTDAVQSAAQVPLDIAALGVDMLSISAHKFYGPKGVGALVVRPDVPLWSTQTGGSHEDGRRAGTLNTPGIVGMVAAYRLVRASLTETAHRLRHLRNQLVAGVVNTVPDAVLTGHPVERLPGHASFAFKDVDGNTLLMHLDQHGIAASSGSACRVGNPRPAPALEAIGLGPEWTRGGLRLTLGHHTTTDEIEHVLAVLPQTIEAVRRLPAPAQ